MTEPRRKSREADSHAGRGEARAPDGAPEEPRTPRPLNSAGRPVAGAGRRTSGSGQPGDPPWADPGVEGEGPAEGAAGGGRGRGWDPVEDRAPGAGGAAADWERLRDGGPWGGAGGDPPPPGSPPSLSSLLVLLEALRGMVPRELERQFSALLREVLLTLRALIDWYLERLDDGAREQRVEDIPID